MIHNVATPETEHLNPIGAAPSAARA